MNLANKLTVSRIALVPFLILFMYLDSFWMRICALIIFVAASLTDLYDGRIARQQNTVTVLGTFLDPLADKLLMSAAFITFVGLKELHVPAWMVIAITAREFIITGLRSIAATRNIVIPANKSGKFKTTSQIITVILLMLVLIVSSALWNYAGTRAAYFLTLNGWSYLLGWILVKMPYWLMLTTTILTLFSGLSYLKEHRSVLQQ